MQPRDTSPAGPMTCKAAKRSILEMKAAGIKFQAEPRSAASPASDMPCHDMVGGVRRPSYADLAQSFTIKSLPRLIDQTTHPITFRTPYNHHLLLSIAPLQHNEHPTGENANQASSIAQIYFVQRSVYTCSLLAVSRHLSSHHNSALPAIDRLAIALIILVSLLQVLFLALVAVAFSAAHGECSSAS
jgi:hypothetical protein